MVRILFVTTPRYDFSTATLVQGLNALPDVELRTTEPGNYTDPSQVLDRKQAADYGRCADVLVLGYNRGVDMELFWSIRNRTAPRVFVDGGDNSELAISVRRFRKLDVLFKREYLLKDNSAANLFALLGRARPGMWGTTRRHSLLPFPAFLGLQNRTTFRDVLRNLAVLPMVRKVCPFPYGIEERFVGTFNPSPRYELSCVLTTHMPEREELITRLRSLRLPGAFIDAIPNTVEDVQRLIGMGAVSRRSVRTVEFGHNERYYAQLRDSRRCISIPGGGFDTLRFWEILAQGSLLVSKRIAIEMPNAPVEGRHYLAFDSFDELKDVLEWSYRNPGEADRVRAAGHELALRFHTTKARAIYVVTTLVERGLLSQERVPLLCAEAVAT